MAKVFLKDVKKVCDNGFKAVKCANLDIADKEFMVIVGPSGCGRCKTACDNTYRIESTSSQA